MAGFYLDFEKPIVDLDQKIDEMIEMSSKDGTDLSSEIVRLKEKREKITKKIYSNLSRWQRVQLARYPKRPYTLDYIDRLSPSFVEPSMYWCRNSRARTVVGHIGARAEVVVTAGDLLRVPQRDRL